MDKNKIHTFDSYGDRVYEKMDSGADDYMLKSDKSPEVHFKGKWIASVSSDDEGSSRWTELKLYCTPNNRYICHTIGGTRVSGEVTRYDTRVCHNIPGVLEHFGQGFLAKELYKSARIRNAIYVE